MFYVDIQVYDRGRYIGQPCISSSQKVPYVEMINKRPL